MKPTDASDSIALSTTLRRVTAEPCLIPTFGDQGQGEDEAGYAFRYELQLGADYIRNEAVGAPDNGMPANLKPLLAEVRVPMSALESMTLDEFERMVCRAVTRDLDEAVCDFTVKLIREQG